MLKEVSSREYPGKKSQKWFANDYFDLVIWFQDAGTIAGFQLCYDKRGLERALTWRVDGGFSHERVDDGEADPEKNRSPILIPDGTCPVTELLHRYAAASVHVDRHVRDFVLSKLKEYEATIKA